MIVLFILLLQYFSIAYSFEINVHYAEGNPELQAFRIEPYIDGSALVVVKNLYGKDCSEPMLRFRIIHSTNGTIIPIDMSLPVPDFNFNSCKYFNKSDENVEYDIGVERQPGLRVYSLTPGYLLVTYLNTTNVAASPAVFGLIINWQGEILSNNYLGDAYINNEGVQFSSKINFFAIEPELGFFVSEFITGSYNIKWKFFSPPDERGQITLINENTITFTQIHSETRFIAFPTMGYGYCVITFGSTSSFRSPVDPQLWVYATFVQAKTNKVSKTVLIYQNTNNPPLKIDDITCGNSFIIVGYSCFTAVSEISINGGRYFVQVDFTSNGSVTDIKEIRDLNITNIDHIFMSMSILFNGGYLLTIHTRINEKNDNVLGYHVLDTNKTFQGSWNLPVTIELPKFGTRYAPMPNNSVVAIKQEGTSDIWNVYYSELPSFIEDEGYFNPIIDATTPKINDTIPMQTPSLSITYESPVKLSSGNISIFEVNGKESYFRQSFNGQTMEFLSSDNNKKITINVFESTFNKPNQLYCVVIEDGFVNHKNTEEPLLGDSYGSVKLDIKSSKSFLNLQSEHEKKKIRDNLAIELSEAASVSPDRIKATEIYQNDQGQVVLLFSISATDAFKSSANNIMKDLQSNLNITNSRFKDFTMDFYFAIVDSKKFDLQIPSFIILITPVVINLVLIVKTTFGDENFRDCICPLGLSKETGSSEEHGSSEEAGLSKETLKLIIWAGFLMFIIEDVPQLIIQVIYKLKIVNYNIIPFITLTISSLIIISGAFSKLSACC
ncbi:unnamed protein product [Rhizophagus irregularis]|uniref:SbsA Ig-like domain-containing protein n=1 Tax=Rhizophagus irregularis TaxID=588596 RepID=A0A915Z2J5_9GLOM|nr:unnamed protein product [Rhizophagus irregularis]